MKTGVALAGIVLFAAFLRLYGLAEESPWWDEIVTLDALDAPGLVGFLQEERAADPPMTPVYFALAWAWAQVGGSSTVWMRLLSVVLGLCCIPILYLLARRLVGREGALAGSLALAASLVHVYYAQEIRVYALATLLALCSMLCLVRWIEADRPRNTWLVGHIILNLLLAFTHLFGVLLFAAQGLFLAFFRRRDIRGLAVWAAAHAAILAALAAWLSTVDTATVHKAADWMVKPGWRDVAILYAIFAGGRPSNENPAAHLPQNFSADLSLAVVIGFTVVSYAAHRLSVGGKRGEPNHSQWQIWLLVLWFVVPVGGLLAASYIWRPCFVYRYVLYSSIPLYVLLGAALAEARPRLLAVLGYTLLWGFQLLAIFNGPFRPDWRGAGDYLEASIKPRDTVVVLQSLNHTALLHNSSVPESRVRPVDVWSEVRPAVEQAHLAGGDAWVVVWLWTEPANIESSLREGGLSYGQKDFAGWPGLRAYHVPMPSPTR